MKNRIFFTVPLACAALAACGNEPQPAAGTNEAEAFAARINSGTPDPNAAGSGEGAPTVAQPLPNAAPGVFVAGTATDPASATCGANQMGMFIGQDATEDAQNQILAIIGGANEVRFVEPGAPFVTPDASVPRLNIMIDGEGIIRDARCG